MKEVKLSFKMKKLVALAMCTVLAMGVMVLPVSADGTSKGAGGYPDDSYTGDVDVASIPDSIQAYYDKTVTLSNGDKVGLYEGVKDVFAAINVSDITQEQWMQVEKAMEIAFTNMADKLTAAPKADGFHVEEATYYYNVLMNDIVKPINGEIYYDGQQKVLSSYDGIRVRLDQVIKPTVSVGVDVASGDAKDPNNIIDAIEKSTNDNVFIDLHEDLTKMPQAVFEAAKNSNKALCFFSTDGNGNSVSFKFLKGIDKLVDVDFGIKTIVNEGIVKNLTDEKAVAFEFKHSGDLPGPMTVRIYNETYKDVEEKQSLILYLLNEQTGKLEKQEQVATVQYGQIEFTITHCSSYVVSEKEINADKLQVAEPKPEAEETDTPIKKTGVTSGIKMMFLLAIGGASVFFVTRKEVKE